MKGYLHTFGVAFLGLLVGGYSRNIFTKYKLIQLILVNYFCRAPLMTPVRPWLVTWGPPSPPTGAWWGPTSTLTTTTTWTAKSSPQLSSTSPTISGQSRIKYFKNKRPFKCHENNKVFKRLPFIKTLEMLDIFWSPLVEINLMRNAREMEKN